MTEHAHSFEELEEESGRPAHPCIMVIFGACGDLTKRKLIPALYNLAKSDLLPRNFAIIGVSLQESSSEAFRAKATQRDSRIRHRGSG